MAFEYMIDYDCAIKERYGVEDFVQRVKDVGRLHVFIQAARDEGKTEEEIQKEAITLIVSAGGDQKSTTIKISDLKERTEEIVAMRGHCRECPANASGNVFGCLGMVNYPIEGSGEEWLMDQFRLTGNPNGSFVQLMIEDNKIDGQNMSAQRPAEDDENVGIPTTLFQRSSPVVREFPTKEGEMQPMTSDQVFALLFGLGKYELSTLLCFLREFGAVDADKAGQRDLYEQLRTMMRLLGQEHPEKIEHLKSDIGEFLIKPSDGDDLSISQLKSFFHAMYIAYQLDSMMLTDA